MTKKHQLFAIITTFIWGTNFVFIKYGLEELPPFLFATLRFGLAAFPLVLFLPKPNTSWKIIAAYGLFIGFGQFGILFFAMRQDISSGVASVVMQTQVFFTIIFASLFFDEKIKLSQWIALLISFSGIVLIAFNVFSIGGQTTILGLILALIASTSWALGNITVKKAGKVNIISFLAYSSLFACPILAVLSLYFEGWDMISSSLQSATIQSVYIILWQTAGNVIIGYGLWNFLLNQYSAAVVTPWSLLVPVFGLSASVVLLNEPMPMWKILAVSLIIFGLFINVYYSRKKIK